MEQEKILKNFEENKEKLNTYLKYLNPILDFLAIQDELQKSDVIFVFGSTKYYVAEHAAKLYLENFAPYILISGHKSERSNNLHKKTEADFMKEEIIKLGVSEEKIITEYKAKQTLWKILFLEWKNLKNSAINAILQFWRQSRFTCEDVARLLKNNFRTLKFIVRFPRWILANIFLMK